MANEPSRTGNITGCHHLALCVHDIDVARPFYGEVLGLDEIPRPPEIADRFRSAWFRLGTAEIHVVENAAFQPLDSPLGPHLAVATDDFDATVRRLEERGETFRFGPGPGPDGIRRVVVADPTGNVFEITEAPLPEA